jgi:hypothetical protein
MGFSGTVVASDASQRFLHVFGGSYGGLGYLSGLMQRLSSIDVPLGDIGYLRCLAEGLECLWGSPRGLVRPGWACQRNWLSQLYLRGVIWSPGLPQRPRELFRDIGIPGCLTEGIGHLLGFNGGLGQVSGILGH